MLRSDWEPQYRDYQQWPPCAQNFLVFTSNLPARVQAHWAQHQLNAAAILQTWMSFQRNPDSCMIDAPEAPALEKPTIQGDTHFQAAAEISLQSKKKSAS
jgi:hypothetical protein